MNLEKFLVISGVPGVHKLVATRSNGLVIEDRKEKRTRFVPVRQNQITPLATVGIYVDGEEGTKPLAEVFQIMLDKQTELPPVDPNAHSSELRAYFTEILPDHNTDMVHINDIKKCIKWFLFMQENGIFEEAREEADPAAEQPDSPEEPSES